MKRTAIARKTPVAPGASAMKRAPLAPSTERKRRTRKCELPSCRDSFEPRSMTHKACSTDCALALVQLKKARDDRKARQAGLERLKSKSKWMAEAQAAMNAWVRYRDRFLPCICCGKWAADDALSGGGWDAGHYLSRGSHPHLRFDERNVFRQRKGCNRPGGTTAAAFRLGVIARIGLAAVEALEADQVPRKYDIDGLKAIKAHYVSELKKLKAEFAHEYKMINE